MKSAAPGNYSALNPDKLATVVSEKYSLKDADCKLVLSGVGDTYSIDTPDNHFILRVYQSTHRNLQQIQAEVNLLLALKDAGVAVSYPIKDTSGMFIQAVETADGIRHAVLFSYAQGKVATLLNKNQLRDLSKQMACFHNVSSAIDLGESRWKFDLETTLFEPLKELQPYFDYDTEDYEWLQRSAKYVEEKLTQIDTSKFSKGYCHFDFLPKNFHFEGDSVTLFDFDFIGYGWLVNDIMTFWQHLCLDVHFGKITQDAADAAYAIFIKAYSEYRPLSDAELIAVPYLSLGFWLFYSAFHATHSQFHAYLEPAHLKPRINLIRQLMERYWDKKI